MKIIVSILLLDTLVLVNLFSQEMPLVYDVENTGADCMVPTWPSYTGLPKIESLPDPFMWSDTSRDRITSRHDWRCRRAEIGAMIQYYELGIKPPRPDTLEAIYTDTLLTVTVIENGDTLTLSVPLSLPEGEGPFPAVIGVGWFPTGFLPADIFNSRGIATIHYREGQVANAWSSTRGDGAFYKLYPDKKRGKFIAFAWGVSRIIDGLAMCPNSKIDLRRLAITGCSYAGKIALFSGAFDERITLTIAQEPGGGGDATWRFSQTIGSSVEILANAQGYAWYHQDISRFNNAVTKLPFDHHEVMAMIAPRALLVLGNPPWVWLTEESGYVGCKAAHEVWKALGVPDRFGFSKVGGHDHCQLPDVQRPEVVAFVEKFLLGNDTANTEIAISPYNTDLSRWITWDTPELSEDPNSIDNSENTINQFDLVQNCPNPFNPVTTINYYLKQDSHVQLSIYDIKGKKVSTILDKQQSAGRHTLTFDGSELASGTYICTLRAGKFVKSTKMVLVR